MGSIDPDPAEIARMGAGRVGTLRINLVWEAVQPSAGAPYDWSHYDAIVGAAAQQGIRVLFTVSSSPSWVASKSNYPPTGPFIAPFRAFVQAAAQRYASNVTYWQLWNEMNAPTFWFDQPSPRQYVQLLKVFSGGVKSGNPRAKVVVGGLFRTPQVWSPGGIPLVRYLPGIYKAGGKRFFDAVSVHPYANAPKDALRAVKQTREIMDRFKDTKARLWITEIGWSTGGQGWAGSPYQATERQQAKNLTKSFSALIGARKSLRLQRVYWHDWEDSPDPNVPNVYQMGLLRGDGTAKPAWKAYQRFARR